MTPETDNASIVTLITRSLSRPFLLAEFTFKRINKQFKEY